MKIVLDGQPFKLYSLNYGVPQVSVLGPTFFPHLYQLYLRVNIISSFIDIFDDDLTIYSSSTPTQNFDSITQNLSSDLTSVVT